MNARLDYLSRQRWFAGGQDVTLIGIDEHAWIREPANGLGVRLEFVTVLVDGTEQTYNVPTSYRSDPYEGFEGALIEHDGVYFVYDALHDAHARTALLSGFFGATVGGLTYSGTLPVDSDAPTIELIAEQSNTSIVIGNDLVLKVFRKVGYGRNPDVELSQALTDDGCTQVAAVRGWITLRDAGEGTVDLAMVSDFIRSATTGWDSARASFRDLLADPDADASEAGGDFAAESERLGETVADIHRRLASIFGTQPWGPAELSALADRLDERCEIAASAAPSVLPYVDAAKSAFNVLRGLTTPVSVQRIHGDLHLGQALRAITGWIVIDFEGEPAMPWPIARDSTRHCAIWPGCSGPSTTPRTRSCCKPASQAMSVPLAGPNTTGAPSSRVTAIASRRSYCVPTRSTRPCMKSPTSPPTGRRGSTSRCWPWTACSPTPDSLSP